MAMRFLAMAAFLFGVSSAKADDWPQWRGPDRSGVSKETGLLKTWPKEGPKLLWTYKNAGAAHSSCAVVGDKLYTLGTRGPDEIVIALDVSKGTELWMAKIGTIYEAFGNWGHGPRSTPTVDGDRLYALGSQGDLVCFDLANKGKEVWRKNLQKDFAGAQMADPNNWGWSESPLIDGPHLICTPGGEKGTLVALNKKDGALVWQSKDLKNQAPYSSIVVAEILGVRQYVQDSYKNTVGGYVHGIAAKDGRLLWSKPLFKGTAYDVSPAPVVMNNLVYATTYLATSGCHCFEIQKKGDGFTATDLYSKENQKVMKNHHGGVVLIDGYIYGYSDNTGWICQDLKIGDLKWAEKEKIACAYTGAIIAATGQLYVLTDKGEVAMFAANPMEFKELGAFQLPESSKLPQTVSTSRDSKTWAHPVIANGKLYVRDHDLIFCFDVKGK